MSYTLVVSEYAYSDNAMRAWLSVDAFGIEFGPRCKPMFTDEYNEALFEFAPASALPVLVPCEGGTAGLIWESAAVIEILADRHPDAGHWPRDPAMKETARSLAARARTGFTALQALPMNLHARYRGYVASRAEREDAASLTRLWEWALSLSEGPYLCGRAFSPADVEFAPIATRLITYGFDLPEVAKAYVETLYAHPSFRRWHACSDAQLRTLENLHMDLPSDSNSRWPRQPVLPSRPYKGSVADAVNELCPYSGIPIVENSLAEIDGQIVGFCNQFCCRRGMADAESWPTVMAAMGRAGMGRAA